MTTARIGVIGRDFQYFGINEVITALLTVLHPGAIGEFFGGLNGAKQLLLKQIDLESREILAHQGQSS